MNRNRWRRTWLEEVQKKRARCGDEESRVGEEKIRFLREEEVDENVQREETVVKQEEDD